MLEAENASTGLVKISGQRTDTKTVREAFREAEKAKNARTRLRVRGVAIMIEHQRTRTTKDMDVRIVSGHGATIDAAREIARIVNSTLPSLSRWFCACGDVIHCEVWLSRTWRGRPVDRAGEHRRACWHGRKKT